MSSPALTAFAAAVDGSTLGAGAKATAKTWGERLYLAAIKEAAVHIRVHLDAELLERPGDTEAEARALLVRSILTRAFTTSDNLALTIAGAMDG